MTTKSAANQGVVGIAIATAVSRADNARTLRTPNASAAVTLPAPKLENQTWLISQVTYARGKSGTTAEVTLMPRTAFVPGGGATDVAPASRWSHGHPQRNYASMIP